MFGKWYIFNIKMFEDILLVKIRVINGGEQFYIIENIRIIKVFQSFFWFIQIEIFIINFLCCDK